MARTPTAVPRTIAALAALLAVAFATPPAAAQPTDAAARGRLLYENHCIACHDRELHWRDRREATDWPSLVAQVRAWQARGELRWSDDDVVAVAGHLNDTIYRYRRPGDRRVVQAGPR